MIDMDDITFARTVTVESCLNTVHELFLNGECAVHGRWSLNKM